MHSKKTRRTPDMTQPMAKPAAAPVGTPAEGALEEKLIKYGIKRVSVDHFYTGGFHYTNLDDAIAQAKRADANS